MHCGPHGSPQEQPWHANPLCRLQIGDFYEAAGVDALVLIQYANLNPMVPKSGIPRAGLPLGNLRRTLRMLVEENSFSVVSRKGRGVDCHIVSAV